MPFGRSARAGRPWIAALLAVYAFALAGTPALHHDLACHQKSPTHCNACTASPLAPRVETGISLAESRLPAAGRVEAPATSAPRPTPLSAKSGRAPPA